MPDIPIRQRDRNSARFDTHFRAFIGIQLTLPADPARGTRISNHVKKDELHIRHGLLIHFIITNVISRLHSIPVKLKLFPSPTEIRRLA
jgi:hypothetical protein